MTCRALEGNVPVGVDDSTLVLDQGLLTFYWGQGQSASIQFLDEPSCTPDSDAWTFLIAPVIDPESLYPRSILCDFYRDLQTVRPAPANRDTVLGFLGEAERLCT